MSKTKVTKKFYIPSERRGVVRTNPWYANPARIRDTPLSTTRRSEDSRVTWVPLTTSSPIPEEESDEGTEGHDYEKVGDSESLIAQVQYMALSGPTLSPIRAPEVIRGTKNFLKARFWARCCHCECTNYFTSKPSEWKCLQCSAKATENELKPCRFEY